MRKHRLVSRHVKFELVYVSSLPKSITCTKQVSYRSDLSQDQCRGEDLSPRCVAAICRIVCLGLYNQVLQRHLTYYDQRKGQPLHVKLTTPKPVETPKPEESEETSKESTAEAETILTSAVE